MQANTDVKVLLALTVQSTKKLTKNLQKVCDSCKSKATSFDLAKLATIQDQDY